MDFNTHDKLGCVKMVICECTELVLQHLCRLYVILYMFFLVVQPSYIALSQRCSPRPCAICFRLHENYFRGSLHLVHSGGNNMAGRLFEPVVVLINIPDFNNTTLDCFIS